MTASLRQAIHATAVAVRDAGVVIRGRSGAGKSRTALALIDLGRVQDVHAVLVGDDRVFVQAVNGRLIVEPHPTIAGKIERRGVGILDMPWQAHAIVRLVVDIVDPDRKCDIPPRSPYADELEAAIARMRIARMWLLSGSSTVDAAAEIFATLRGDRGCRWRPADFAGNIA